MSLDISIEAQQFCPHCQTPLPGSGFTIHSQNITHNLTPMWSLAGVYELLYKSEGRQITEEYISGIEAGIKLFEARYPEFEKLNSPNGWGLAENALPWLKRWRDACKENLGARIHISK